MNFPNLSAAKRITLDLETKDSNLKKLGPGWCRRDGYVVGYAVGADGLPASYYPIAHAVGDNLDRDSVLRWVQDILNSGLPIGGHNIGYDIGWTLAEGLKLPRNVQLRDSMTGAALLDEDLTHYSLSSLGKLWLGDDKQEEGIRAYADEHKLDPKADLWRMPASVVGPYACQDVDLTAKLIEYIEDHILQEVGLQDAYELESALIPCSILMRWQGIEVDEEALDRASAEFRILGDNAIREMKELSGLVVDPWKQPSCLAYFKEVGVKAPEVMATKGRKKGQMVPTIRAEWLEYMSTRVPALGALMRARKAMKMRATFAEGWRQHVVNGKIHPEWHQTRSDEGGTISFRYSCSNPNLQQVPYRDPDVARILRPIFKARSGERLYSLDYSQQEPRLLVHFAARNGLPGSDTAVERYQDPKADFHNLAVETTGLERDIAKQINLGIIYGMGRKRLAAKINKSEAETKAILETYNNRMPYMRGMTNLCMRVAAERGYIKTIAGHIRRFNLWEVDEWTNHDDERDIPRPLALAQLEWPRKALRRAYTFTGLNALIQTSAAGQMKRAMRACFAAGIIPTLQIHDELLISGDDARAAEVADYMRNAVQLLVPSLLDVASGPNWYEAATFKKHPEGLSNDHKCEVCHGA